MQCDKCRNEAVFFQSCSGRHLCSRHLAMDVEARAKRAIRSHHWMRPGDHIAVVLTGDTPSAALAFFLKKLLAGRRDIRLSIVPVGEGVTDGCSQSVLQAVTGLTGALPAEILIPRGHGAVIPERPTKIALAFTLDEIAQEVLARFLFGNAEDLIHPPQAVAGGIPVICPFIAIPAEELEIYRDSQGTGSSPAFCPHPPDTHSQVIETLFREYNRRHPATRYALLNLAEDLSRGGVAEIAAASCQGSGIQELHGEVHGDGS